MKTILVLTDFTMKDDHAAHYALRLAQKLKANILLCNVYPRVDANTAAHNSAYVNEIYADLESQSKDDMRELAGRLRQQLSAGNDRAFKPEIQQCSKGGHLTTVINEIVDRNDILMAVIGGHSNDDFFTFINVDHARQIIEEANCPVLVLPYQVPFKGFNKIAFASDLNRDSGDVLYTIFNIATNFDSEILITHVGQVPLGEVIEKNILKRLLENGHREKDNAKIQYCWIQNKSVTEGLKGLAERTDIDLLVVVHRKRHVLRKLFERSVTKHLADHLIKPMLVFPQNHKSSRLPVL